MRCAPPRAGRLGEWRWRFERANQHFPWLLLLDLRGWRETPRDRLIDQARARPRGPPRRRTRSTACSAAGVPGRGPLPGGPPRPMRILFVMRHFGYVRPFEHPLARARGAPGTRSSCCWGRHARARTRASGVVARLRAAHPDVTATTVGARAGRPLGRARGRGIRDARDYLRYLEPPLERLGEAAGAGTRAARRRGRAGSPTARSARSRRGAPGARPRAATPRRRRAARGRRAGAAGRAPARPRARHAARLRRAAGRVRPRGARAAGSPPCTASTSWDNLTTKGLVHEVADLTTVWNGTQVRGGRGAPRRAARAGRGHRRAVLRPLVRLAARRATARAFCRAVGLPDERAFVLYLCSSGFIAGDEVEPIAEWVGALRARPEPEWRTSGVLVRPHPANAALGGGGRRGGVRRRASRSGRGTTPSPTTTRRAPTTSTRSTTPRPSSA